LPDALEVSRRDYLRTANNDRMCHVTSTTETQPSNEMTKPELSAKPRNSKRRERLRVGRRAGTRRYVEENRADNARSRRI
jgi:hypothetical protein